MNLYIALLSETFARVYQNATANASLLQATTILQIEKALSKKRRIKAETYIHESCSPLVRILCSLHGRAFQNLNGVQRPAVFASSLH